MVGSSVLFVVLSRNCNSVSCYGVCIKDIGISSSMEIISVMIRIFFGLILLLSLLSWGVLSNVVMLGMDVIILLMNVILLILFVSLCI